MSQTPSESTARERYVCRRCGRESGVVAMLTPDQVPEAHRDVLAPGPDGRVVLCGPCARAIGAWTS